MTGNGYNNSSTTPSRRSTIRQRGWHRRSPSAFHCASSPPTTTRPGRRRTSFRPLQRSRRRLPGFCKIVRDRGAPRLAGVFARPSAARSRLHYFSLKIGVMMAGPGQYAQAIRPRARLTPRRFKSFWRTAQSATRHRRCVSSVAAPLQSRPLRATSASTSPTIRCRPIDRRRARGGSLRAATDSVAVTLCSQPV